MKSIYSKRLAVILGLTLAVSGTVSAQKRAMDNEIKRSNNAANVFSQIMRTPDKAIPSTVLDGAECVAVFPSVRKGAFVLGGRWGNGVASCRSGRAWSAPIYLTMRGGSFGWQIGGQSTDFVLLFMNKDGLDSLLSSKFTVGGEASVAAGPVGRTAAASTDIKLDAQILSYSRTRGLFAGLALKGVAISPDDKAMKRVYGEEASAREVLQDNRLTAPRAVRAFPTRLARYSSRRAER